MSNIMDGEAWFICRGCSLVSHRYAIPGLSIQPQPSCAICGKPMEPYPNTERLEHKKLVEEILGRKSERSGVENER